MRITAKAKREIKTVEYFLMYVLLMSFAVAILLAAFPEVQVFIAQYIPNPLIEFGIIAVVILLYPFVLVVALILGLFAMIVSGQGRVDINVWYWWWPTPVDRGKKGNKEVNRVRQLVKVYFWLGVISFSALIIVILVSMGWV